MGATPSAVAGGSFKKLCSVLSWSEDIYVLFYDPDVFVAFFCVLNLVIFTAEI